MQYYVTVAVDTRRPIKAESLQKRVGKLLKDSGYFDYAKADLPVEPDGGICMESFRKYHQTQIKHWS